LKHWRMSWRGTAGLHAGCRARVLYSTLRRRQKEQASTARRWKWGRGERVDGLCGAGMMVVKDPCRQEKGSVVSNCLAQTMQREGFERTMPRELADADGYSLSSPSSRGKDVPTESRYCHTVGRLACRPPSPLLCGPRLETRVSPGMATVTHQ